MTLNDQDMNSEPETQDIRLRLLEMASRIVAAQLGTGSIGRDEVPDFIAEVMTTLEEQLEGGQRRAVLPEDAPVPFVPVEDSVQPDYIVCLEDGVKKKMLKRYLETTYDMTPDEYRARWGLDADYPMVAPNHSKLRSRLAKDSKLGHNRGKRAKL